MVFEVKLYGFCLVLHILGRRRYPYIYRDTDSLINECQCQQETGKIPKYTDSERLKFPKTDC